MTDSTGLTWSYGPLHAGNGSTDCFTEETSSHKTGGLTGGDVAGAAIGAFVAGLVAAVIAFLIFNLCRERRTGSEAGIFENPHIDRRDYNDTDINGEPKDLASPGLNNYQVEPYDPQGITNTPGSPMSGTTAAGGSSMRAAQNVYVVHHDQGPAPVSIYTQDGAQVVELPPTYSGEPSSSRGGPSPAPAESDVGSSTHARGSLSVGSVPPGIIAVATGHGRTVSGSSQPEKGAQPLTNRSPTPPPSE